MLLKVQLVLSYTVKVTDDNYEYIRNVKFVRRYLQTFTNLLIY